MISFGGICATPGTGAVGSAGLWIDAAGFSVSRRALVAADEADERNWAILSPAGTALPVLAVLEFSERSARGSRCVWVEK